MPQSPALLTCAPILARSPAAFRMALRNWPPERLRDHQQDARTLLTPAYRAAYLEELAYRKDHPYSRGGRENWE